MLFASNNRAISCFAHEMRHYGVSDHVGPMWQAFVAMFLHAIQDPEFKQRLGFTASDVHDLFVSRYGVRLDCRWFESTLILLAELRVLNCEFYRYYLPVEENIHADH